MITTTRELIKVLEQWPENTGLVIDVEPVIQDCETEYEWHEFVAYEPSEQEKGLFPKMAERGESTYTTLKVLPEVVGC